MRSRQRTAAALAVVLTWALFAAPGAQAAAYRYWTYWQESGGEWSFATAGPASTVPADGSVEGWRFAVTTQAGSAGDAPGVVPSFAEICGGLPAAAGSKRVALVVDMGPEQIAPPGQAPPTRIIACTEVAADATGYQVLRSATTVRTENGLICGIDGYPTGECAPVVDDAEATGPDAPDASSAANAGPATAPSPATAIAPATEPAPGAGGPWATLAVAALVAMLVAGLLWRRRRA